MKFILFPLLLFCLSLNAQNTPKTVELTRRDNACKQSEWKLVFSDEFDGKTLDTDKWYSYYPYGKDFSQNCNFCRAPSPAAQIYKDENLVVKDGLLTIVTKEEEAQWRGIVRPYSSGLIFSKHPINFYHGKFEMRCKIPKGRGFIPAFWLWGGAGEIDIFEFGGHRPHKQFMTIHMYPKGVHIMEHDWSRGADFSADFHVFSLEWEPRQIIFKVDGKPVKIITRYTTLDGKPLFCPQALEPGQYLQNNFFPQGPLHVIANVTVSTGKDNSFTLAPKKQTDFPAGFEIDYVRVYQR